MPGHFRRLACRKVQPRTALYSFKRHHGNTPTLSFARLYSFYACSEPQRVKCIPCSIIDLLTS